MLAASSTQKNPYQGYFDCWRRLFIVSKSPRILLSYLGALKTPAKKPQIVPKNLPRLFFSFFTESLFYGGDDGVFDGAGGVSDVFFDGFGGGGGGGFNAGDGVFGVIHDAVAFVGDAVELFHEVLSVAREVEEFGEEQDAEK